MPCGGTYCWHCRSQAKERKEQKDKEDKAKADAARELFFENRRRLKAEEKAMIKLESDGELARKLESVWREAEAVVFRTTKELERLEVCQLRSAAHEHQVASKRAVCPWLLCVHDYLLVASPLWVLASSLADAHTLDTRRLLLQLKIEHMGEIITAADRERVTKDRKKMAARVDLA